MANQYDPLVIKSGLAGVLGTDTLRADVMAAAPTGLVTTGLAAGDVVQVTADLTLSKAVNTSTSPIVGVFAETGSVVREGVVVATFKIAPTANGDAVYLSSTAGQLTTTKPTMDMVHEVGVVVDFANRKVLLQQKPVIALPATPPPYLWMTNSPTSNHGFSQLLVSSGALTRQVQPGLNYNDYGCSLLNDGKGNVWGSYYAQGTDTIIKLDAVTGARLGGMDRGASAGGQAGQIAFDGINYWYSTNVTGSQLRCIDINLSPVRSVSLPSGASNIIYDGVGNIWVSSYTYLVKVRVSDGAVLGSVEPDYSYGSYPLVSDKTNIWVVKYNWNGGGVNVSYYVRKVRISDFAVTTYGSYQGGPQQGQAAWDGTYLWLTANMDTDHSGWVRLDKIRLSDMVRVDRYTVPDSSSGVFFDGTNLWLKWSTRFRKMTTGGATIGDYPGADQSGGGAWLPAFTNIVMPGDW